MAYPAYQCHKVVTAFEIGKIEGCRVFPIQELMPPFDATPEFIGRHPLNLPGYVVFYEDGYVSYSPKATFEAGYSSLEPRDPEQWFPTEAPRTPEQAEPIVDLDEVREW